jgi:uncharacterized protein YqjF (DUF2071 family)
MTTFPETNLRTYVRRPNGRDGISRLPQLMLVLDTESGV